MGGRNDSRCGQKDKGRQQSRKTSAICREKLPCPAKQLSALDAVRADSLIRVGIPHSADGAKARFRQVGRVNLRRLAARQLFRIAGKQADRLQTAVGKQRKKNSLPLKIGNKDRRGASFLHGKPADLRQGILFGFFVFPDTLSVLRLFFVPRQHIDGVTVCQQSDLCGLAASVPVDKAGKLQPFRINPDGRQRRLKAFGHPIHTQHRFLLSRIDSRQFPILRANRQSAVIAAIPSVLLCADAAPSRRRKRAANRLGYIGQQTVEQYKQHH